MLVDEAHHYKNGGIFTKMRNFAGISGNSAKKVPNLFLILNPRPSGASSSADTTSPKLEAHECI